MSPFVQSPCARCGAAVWISTATGLGQCARCQAPTQLQPGAWQGPPASQGPTPPPVPPRRRGRVVALALLALLALGAGVGVAVTRLSEPSLSTLGVDAHAAEPEALIRLAGERARALHRDAGFRLIRIEGMRPNGTVDLSNPRNRVVVTYLSPSAAESSDPGVQGRSCVRFTFSAEGLSQAFDVSGNLFILEEGPKHEAMPLAGCTARQLGATLTSEGAAPTSEFLVEYGLDAFRPVRDMLPGDVYVPFWRVLWTTGNVPRFRAYHPRTCASLGAP